MSIFVCSDFHFFHDRDFVWEKRGFKSVGEMNASMIQRYNELIKEDDIVYILGDLGLNAEPDEILACASQLNGRKYLALGNHDTGRRADAYKESGIFEDVQFAFRLQYRHRTFYFSHYPTLVANESGPKIYNIHGHTHGAEKFQIPGGRNFNVSPETNNYYPLLLDDIIEAFKERGM